MNHDISMAENNASTLIEAKDASPSLELEEVDMMNLIAPIYSPTMLSLVEFTLVC
jgi:hypothetical protein